MALRGRDGPPPLERQGLAAQWSNSGKGGGGVSVFEGGTMSGLFAEDDGLGRETRS